MQSEIDMVCEQAFIQQNESPDLTRHDFQNTSFFAADLKTQFLKQDSDDQQDVKLEDIMKVSFTQKALKKPNDSSLSIKFGDVSAVGGVISDKSLIFQDGHCNNDVTLEDQIYALDERSDEDESGFPDVSAI